MNWKDVLKSHCGTTERADDDEESPVEEKRLYGNQHRIDANKDGKISRKDFEILNKRELREGATIISHDECKDMERKILAEVKREGGALGMKNLKGIGSPKKLKMVLEDMKKRGTINEHANGDFYTHKPKK